MIRTAVVGFGFMGMTHAVNILRNPGLSLAAIIDKDLDGIHAKLTSKSGNFSTGDIDPKVIASITKYSDLTACLEKENALDAVHICVHTDLHYALAKQALEHGKHVLLEKPMTLEISQGEELIALAAKNNCTLMVGHVLRFMSPYAKLKQWVDDNTYGNLKFLSMTRFSGVPAWGQWKEKQKAFGSSGGALFDLLIHDIDFAQYLLGDPDWIEAKYLPGSLSSYDYISAFWDYGNSGTTVKLEGGNTFHTNYPFQAGYMAAFEKASVLYTTLQSDVITISNDEKKETIEAEDGSDGFYNEIDYFYTCITSGQKPARCMPESSLETIKLCYRHIK